MIPLPFYIFKRHSVPGEISCFRDYGQKPALSLLYYFEIQKDKIAKLTNVNVNTLGLVSTADPQFKSNEKQLPIAW